MRWIETQALLFGQREQGGLGVEEYVEVGLGNAPTLANLGAKTLRLPEFAGNDTVVYNVGRDEGRVYMTDTDSLVPDDEPEEAAASAPVETAPAGGSAVAKLGSGAAPANAVTEAAQTTDGSVAGQSTGLSDSSRGLQSGQAAAGRTVRCRRRRPALQGFRCHRRAHGLLRQGAHRPDRQQRHH